MTESMGFIHGIIALGGVKCILVLVLVFWGIGLRGMVGTILALMLGCAFVLMPLQAGNIQSGNSHEVNIQKVQTRIVPAVRDYFSSSNTQLESRFGADGTKVFLAVVSDVTLGLGAVIFIVPFLLIDLVALFIFKLLDFGWYRVEYLTLPIKILLFLSVDGVNLVSQMLINNY